jgi:hypothetical protein
MVAIAAMLLAGSTSAGEIPSAFFISKTQNKNQVHFAVRVDDACAPMGPAPVHAYWRMLERGPRVTEPLLDKEQRAYGIERQTMDGRFVRITLRAVPSRPITIQTWRAADGTCASSSAMTISGFSARLFNVHVALKAFGVDYLLLTGWRDDGAVVRERVDP